MHLSRDLAEPPPEEEPFGVDDPRSDGSCGPALGCGFEEAASMGACFDSQAEQKRFDRRLAEVRAAAAAG